MKTTYWPLLLFGMCVLLACGGKTALLSNDAGSGVCDPAPTIENVTVTLEEDSCMLTGTDAEFGSTYTETCDGTSCTFAFADGAGTCGECQALDHTNTCPNGIPTCADWLPWFDFSDSTLVDNR